MSTKSRLTTRPLLILLAVSLVLSAVLIGCTPKETPPTTTPSTPPPVTTPTTPPTTTPTTPPTTPPATPPPATEPPPTPPPALPNAQDFKFTGAIETKGTDTWVIGGRIFRVGSGTMFDAGLATGATATVEFDIVNGSMLARRIETPVSGVGPGDDFKFTGTVESKGADAWVIGGQTFKVTTATTLDTGLAVGVTATVEFAAVNGEKVARKIATPVSGAGPEDFTFTGTIQSKGADTWLIGGSNFKVTTTTVLDTGLIVGGSATVEFDLVGTEKIAKKIETPVSGAGPDEDFNFTGVIESMTAGSWVVGGKTFKITANTLLDTDLALGGTATVEFTIAGSESIAGKIETPVSGAAPGEDFKFTGAIESRSADTWVIGGQSFKVGAGTMLDAGLAVGGTATVEFTVVNGVKVADQIETPLTGVGPGEDFHFTGVIGARGATDWMIGGKPFKTDTTTLVDLGMTAGAPARVEFRIEADGTMRAVSIQSP